jgi:hypothetical protein
MYLIGGLAADLPEVSRCSIPDVACEYSIREDTERSLSIFGQLM